MALKQLHGSRCRILKFGNDFSHDPAIAEKRFLRPIVRMMLLFATTPSDQRLARYPNPPPIGSKLGVRSIQNQGMECNFTWRYSQTKFRPRRALSSTSSKCFIGPAMYLGRFSNFSHTPPPEIAKLRLFGASKASLNRKNKLSSYFFIFKNNLLSETLQKNTGR